MNRTDFSHVVVGGGVAGTFAAWRLAMSGAVDPSRIALFEMLPEIGGRLKSVALPGLGGVRRAELGGMRYLTSQPMVTNLVLDLQQRDPVNFETVPFAVDSRNNMAYVRNKYLRTPDLKDESKVPYDLAPLERGRDPLSLLTHALNCIVPDAVYKSEDEWEEIKRTFMVDGQPLYTLGLWNLLERVLSPEAYRFVHTACGYNTTVGNWNAADAIPWFVADFCAGAAFTSIRAGFDALPKRLLKEAIDKGITFRQQEVKGWEPLDSPYAGVRLNLADEESLTAEHLVLAMPKRSLDRLSMPRTSHFVSMTTSVTSLPMFKLFMGYPYPWWRQLGMKAGQTVTDLSLRQIYYWGSNYDGFFNDTPESTGGITNDDQNSLMMASYCDGREKNFWVPLTGNRHGSLAGIIDLRNHEDLSITNMVRTVQDQLRSIHAINYIPEPYVAAYANWSAEPFGGGWNSWNIGARSWEVKAGMLKPFDDMPVYVCGEAYSNQQGWVEGALQTTEEVLVKKLGLPATGWLPMKA
ncbi:FAD-dependent oxidoreductase [Fodinicurvata sp. EGI_FJ10296]|uniref:flavin monoamine oxidase family protein n=1 Tax=Fodinicurvata sp. EGI_FJ10296 TaxID=3231908 RepID=UPI003451F455